MSLRSSATDKPKKNVRRIAIISILAIACILCIEFGLGLFMGSIGSYDDNAYPIDERIGSVSRNLQPAEEYEGPVTRNQAAIQARERRRQEIRRHERGEGGSPQAPSLFANLLQFSDPKSITVRSDAQQVVQVDAVQVQNAEVEAQNAIINEAENAIIAEGETIFRVHPQMGDANSAQAFVPAEILIEILNPNAEYRYSVTVVSQNKYTGTAMLVSERQFTEEPLVYSWRPEFPGEYEVLVHEIDGEYAHKTPLIQPPHPILIREGVPGAGVSMLKNRIQNMPPCQTVDRADLYSHWDGSWLGPDFNLHENNRFGWSFVPHDRMGCKIETFDREAIRAIPEKKKIYILGRSVERGIFLSLIDMMLTKSEKKMLKHSVIGKCWGRASVTKGNLEVMYQDFRVNAFEDPTEPKFIECHNEKLVKQPGSSFIENATLVWEEIFQREESEWPSVVFLVTGLGALKFKFRHHVAPFVATLPPNWKGTLFLGDFEFSGRASGMVSVPQYENYLKQINQLVLSLNDPRVRWIDGDGISKEMRMYGQKGADYVARSQHFHANCMRKDPVDNNEGIVMCSNVTEMMGHLLLGHALGPKAEYMERLKQNPPNPRQKQPVRWCHACPECMLPFHITPYPEMECIDGPIARNTYNADCGAVRSHRGELGSNDGKDDEHVNPLLCPKSCLESPVTDQFGSETDTVFVRQCPI